MFSVAIGLLLAVPSSHAIGKRTDLRGNDGRRAEELVNGEFVASVEGWEDNQDTVCSAIDPERLNEIIEAAHEDFEEQGLVWEGDVLPGSMGCESDISLTPVPEGQEIITIYLYQTTSFFHTAFHIEFGHKYKDEWFPECWKSFSFAHFGWVGASVGVSFTNGLCVIDTSLMDQFMASTHTTIIFASGGIGGANINFNTGHGTRRFFCNTAGAGFGAGVFSGELPGGFGGPVLQQFGRCD